MFLKTSAFICALLLLCGAGARTTQAQQTRAATPSASPSSSAPATAEQQQQPASPQATSQQAETGTEDLSITANVTARELRFEVVPEPKVEFTGKPERKTSWEAERQNLPRPVRPGVTYRDIGIQLKITSVFADIDRIVAEALGEVPATNDDAPAQPAPAPTQQDTAPPSTAPPTGQPPSGEKPL